MIPQLRYFHAKYEMYVVKCEGQRSNHCASAANVLFLLVSAPVIAPLCHIHSVLFASPTMPLAMCTYQAVFPQNNHQPSQKKLCILHSFREFHINNLTSQNYLTWNEMFLWHFKLDTNWQSTLSLMKTSSELLNLLLVKPIRVKICFKWKFVLMLIISLYVSQIFVPILVTHVIKQALFAKFAEWQLIDSTNCAEFEPNY